MFEGLSCEIDPGGLDYLAPKSGGYAALEKVAQDVVTGLLSGAASEIELCGQEIAGTPAAPDIAAVFGPREQTARILAAAVVATIVDRERTRPNPSRMSLRQAAVRVVDEIVLAMRHGGDPSACEMQFEDSFRQWASLTDLAVPENVSKTGWCQKSFVLPTGPDGHVQACLASPICKASIGPGPAYARTVFSASPPAPGDPRASVQVPGGTPSPPPTKAEVEKEIRRKMIQSGEGAADQQKKQEFTEIAAYLEALGGARRALTMALGLSDKSTDLSIMNALGSIGISSSEVLDWFDGCNLDPNCFREQMNIALGEAKLALRDNRAKMFAALGAVAALGLFVFWRR
jgi:hypothetical protein